MDKIDKLQKLYRILKERRLPVSSQVLSEEIDCSVKTIERNLFYLRDGLGAPLLRKPRLGWQLDDSGDTFELVGTWLTSDELIGLASLLTILTDMDSDFINDELDPVRKQIEKMLSARDIDPKAFNKKIKVISINKQTQSSDIFNTISGALIKNKRLTLHYQNYQGEKTNRIISPQKLIHYQENWYLDSYCHLREELRSFKLSRITSVTKDPKKAKTVPQKQLNDFFASSYGIFSGKANRTAKLRFQGNAARDVAMQQWHPNQIGEWDGHNYLLTIPFNKDQELIRDILKHGNDVEVLSPAVLRKKVVNIAAGIIGINTGKRVRA